MFNASEGGKLTQTFEFSYTADGVEQTMSITWSPQEYYRDEPRRALLDEHGNPMHDAQGNPITRPERFDEWLDRVVTTPLFRDEGGNPITCGQAREISPGNVDIMRVLVAAVRQMSDPNRRRSPDTATGWLA